MKSVLGVAALPNPLRELLQMVPRVCPMKAPPFLRSQWPKNWMVQQFDSGSESLFGIGEGGIQRDQRVIERTQ